MVRSIGADRTWRFVQQKHLGRSSPVVTVVVEAWPRGIKIHRIIRVICPQQTRRVVLGQNIMLFMIIKEFIFYQIYLTLCALKDAYVLVYIYFREKIYVKIE